MLAVIVGVRAEQIAVDRCFEVLDERELSPGYVVSQGTYKGKPVLTCRTGMGEERVKGILDYLIHEHPISAIVSARMASAIPPDLKVGDLAFCPRTILWREGGELAQPSQESDLRLLEMAGHAATRAAIHHMAGDCLTLAPLRPVPLDREALCVHPNLAVVDTEGYWIAETAFEHGIPFLSARVSLGDVYDQAPEAISMVGRKSYVSRWALFQRALTNPTRLPNLLRLADAVRTSSRSLSRFSGAFLKEWEQQPFPTPERPR